MRLALPTSNSMKLRALIPSPIFSHLCQALRALTRAKSLLMDLLQKNKRSKKSSSLCSSIRLHYNFCSSHVLPMPQGSQNSYYDSTWNSSLASMEESDEGPPVSALPHWLEEKRPASESDEGEEEAEIDRLADVFIANLHEKFRLEKQESYRLFQEMLARGL